MEFEHAFVLFLIPVLALFFYRMLGKNRQRKSKVFVLNRFVISALLVIAIATPFNVQEKLVEGKPKIVVFLDNSTSMELYRSSVERVLAAKPENVEVRSVSFGDKTSLGDALIYNLGGGEDALLVTHGGSNFGTNLEDAAQVAGRMNSSIHVLNMTPEKSDVAVSVQGNKRATPGNEENFNVVLEKVGEKAEYTLELTVDGARTLSTDVTQDEDKKIIPYKHTFASEGTHTIEAQIKPKSADYFSENNVFYKSVVGVAKPKILFLTREYSPLALVFRGIYSIKTSGDFSSPENFDAVVFNNIPETWLLKEDVESLKSYLLKGGGAVVVGGRESYDLGRYKDSYFETLLPVKSIPSAGEQKVSVVFLIDVSGSTREYFGSYTKSDVEKALLIDMIDDLSSEDAFGVIAFWKSAMVVVPFGIYPDRTAVKDTISRLTFGEVETDPYAGQDAADTMLSGAFGSRNVVIISDGGGWSRLSQPIQQLCNQKASKMAQKGIRTHTIGVGFDTDEEFMKELAAYGGGAYFKPTETQGLDLVFKKEEKKIGDFYQLAVSDSSHFITEDLKLDAGVTGYNDVTVKSSARTLVSTSNFKPIVSVWRFGLGRVVSFTTDDSTHWASQVLTKDNAKLVSAMLNWAVGDPERSKPTRIISEDGEVGAESQISVISTAPVTLTINDEQAELSQLGGGEYVSLFTPRDRGFFSLQAGSYRDLMAANYPEEFMNLGFDAELVNVARITRGEVHEIKPELFDEIKRFSLNRSKQLSAEVAQLRFWFIAPAIFLFFAEVAVRRILEIRKISQEAA